MHFHVPDMSCGSCVRHVNEAIARIDPGAKVEADTVSRRITVSTGFCKNSFKCLEQWDEISIPSSFMTRIASGCTYPAGLDPAL